MKEETKSKKNALPTVVGFLLIFIIFQSLLLTNNQAYYTNYGISYTDFRTEKINWFYWVILLLLTIVNCKWVTGISKGLKRNTIFWAIFTFLLPPLALIIIGLLDEKKHSVPKPVRPVAEPEKNRMKIGDLYLEDDEEKE